MLIGGSPVGSSTGQLIGSINPATEDEFASFPEASQEDVDRAVKAAQMAAPNWAAAEYSTRASYLRQIAAALRKYATDLAHLETSDAGKPIYDTLNFDVADAAHAFEFFGSLGGELYGETIPLKRGMLDYTLRTPVGVVAQIAPWNFPLVNAAWKIAPAIAMGNAVVFKPSELASLTTVRLGEIIMEAELPAGVVNIVTGGPSVGESLVSHGGVSKVSFTGSTATGQRILERSAHGIKPSTLELGGKCANVVFPDADLDAALEGALFAGFYNAGQVCTAGSRLLLHEDIFASFTEKLVAAASRIQIGDPTDPVTRLGPLISEAQKKRADGYIDRGLEEGARIVFQSQRPTGRGFFVPVTIFDRILPSMRIAQEEIFGPVLCLISFRNEEEAIRIANGTPYGLAAGVWTQDLRKAHAVAAQLDCGTVWINTYNLVTPQTPAPARRNSGIGVELGIQGLQEYTQLKNVVVNYNHPPLKYFA